MFNKYYQGELEYLRTLGSEFARAHPATAGMLSERSDDPDVERLLEGVAFLTAQLKQRLDDAYPRLTHALCELLLPQYLRPIPATTIVEFTPQRAPKERLLLPQGMELGTRPVLGTRCTFTTTGPVELHSIEVVRAELQERPGDRARITLELALHQASADMLVKSGHLRLFLHGALPLSSLLLTWFLRHCVAIRARPSRGRRDVNTVTLSPASLRAPGFTSELTLLPWPQHAAVGHRVVQEYVSLPEKFLFVDLNELARLRPALANRVVLEFDFHEAPPLPTRISKENFRTNCAPVVNLFPVNADPIRPDPLRREHRLTAPRLNPAHVEVFSVDEVVGVEARTARRRRYRAFTSFTHGGAEDAYYDLRRARSPIDDGIDTYIGLSAPRDSPPAAPLEVVSVAMTCTNRDLAGELGVSDVAQPTARSKTLARFRNITAVSKPARPPLDGALHWRMLGLLAAQRRSVADLEVLRSLFELYLFDEDSDYQRARVVRRRVEAIRRVTTRRITLRLDQSPVRGVETTIELDESGFAGPGDAFLMGGVLNELLAGLAPINSFNRLVVTLHPSRREYRWRPRNGQLNLL